MANDTNNPNLTLEELSRRTDLPLESGGCRSTRGDVDWARTLVIQAALLAGLFGLRLPLPKVNDGPGLLWQIGEVNISVTLRELAPIVQPPGTAVFPPDDYDDFRFSGLVYRRKWSGEGQHPNSITFEISGNFRADLILAALVNWFQTHNTTSGWALDLDRPLTDTPPNSRYG